MEFLYFLEGLRNAVLDAVFSAVTLLGEETVFMVIGMIVFWCVDKNRGYYLLFTGFFGTLINQFLKIVCRVPRPWVKDPDFTIVESARKAASGYSFPSGHTQTAVGLFGGLARTAKKRAFRITMLVLAAAVALSRMYLGVHTPADVLVSLGIASVLVLCLYPLFEKGKESPHLLTLLFSALICVVGAHLAFLSLAPIPCATAEEAQNLLSAQKNGYTLLGCAVGLLLCYLADLKWIRFETDALWWVQIFKAAVGLLLVVAVKEGLRAPLDSLFGGHMIARAIRYFLMVVTGGILWPMTFGYLSPWGRAVKLPPEPWE